MQQTEEPYEHGIGLNKLDTRECTFVILTKTVHGERLDRRRRLSVCLFVFLQGVGSMGVFSL